MRRTSGKFRKVALALILMQACTLAFQFDTRAIAESLEAKSSIGFCSWVASTASSNVRELDNCLVELLDELSTIPQSDNSKTGSRLGWHSKVLHSPNDSVWIQVDLGQRLPLDCVALVPALGATQDDSGPGYGFPLRFRIEISDEEVFSRQELIVDLTDQDVANPRESPLIISASGKSGRFLRVTVTKPWPRREDWIVALGELLVFSNGRNVAITRPVQASTALTSLPAWDASNLTDGQSSLGPPVSRDASPTNGYLAVQEPQAKTTKWVQIDLGQPMPIDEVRLFPARPQDFADTPGNGFPVRFEVVASLSDSFDNRIALYDTGETDFVNPGDNLVTIPCGRQTACFIRVTAKQLYNRGEIWSFALSEMQVWSDGENVALGKSVTALDSFDEAKFPRWNPAFLVDGFNSKNRILDDLDWLKGLSRRHEIGIELASIHTQRALKVDQTIAFFAKLSAGILASAVLVVALFFWRGKIAKRLAVENLRRRIAADLHDEIGSNLSGIALLAEAARREGGPKHALEDFETIANVATKTHESLREIVWFIGPGKISLRELTIRMRETAPSILGGIDCEFTIPATLHHDDCPLEFTRNIWLIFKEVLHNIARHSHASQVTIGIAEPNNGFEMEICDNGCGFVEENIEPGNGLVNLRRRAAELRGTLQVKGAPGIGTIIHLHIPSL